MRTSEEKLLMLLQVAVENGWKEYSWIKGKITKVDYLDGDRNFKLMVCTVQFTYENGLNDWVEVKFSDLVTNFKEDEISFIGALCRQSDKSHKGLLEKTEDLVWFDGMEMWELVVTSYLTKKEYYGYRDKKYKYSIRPTSERLDWLFKTFKHLLNAN